MRQFFIAAAFFLVTGGAQAASECVNTQSSFVHQVCFDAQTRRMDVLLNNRWYQYCGVPESTFQSFISADSKGRYFNQYVKGRYRC